MLVTIQTERVASLVARASVMQFDVEAHRCKKAAIKAELWLQ